MCAVHCSSCTLVSDSDTRSADTGERSKVKRLLCYTCNGKYSNDECNESNLTACEGGQVSIVRSWTRLARSARLPSRLQVFYHFYPFFLILQPVFWRFRL